MPKIATETETTEYVVAFVPVMRWILDGITHGRDPAGYLQLFPINRGKVGISGYPWTVFPSEKEAIDFMQEVMTKQPKRVAELCKNGQLRLEVREIKTLAYSL